MLSRKSCLFARAGLLGIVTALMGSTAQAALMLDATDKPTVKYAEQTLTKGEMSGTPENGGGSITKDGTTYYVVGSGSDGVLNVMGAAG